MIKRIKQWLKDYWMAIIILIIAITGARLQSEYILYLLFSLILCVVILATLGKIESRKYPIFIYCISLSLLYQVTLMSNYLMGSDIHYEFSWAYRTYTNGYWDYDIPKTYNTAAITTFAFPMIARVLHLDLTWMFKIIPPLFLAGVPVIMYHLFKQQFSEKVSFLSIFFFVSVPTFTMELVGIAKQQMGEFFFILCFFLIIDEKLKIGFKKRVGLICIAIIMTILSHYTMTGALWFYLIISLILLTLMKFIPFLRSHMHFPLKVFVAIVAIAILLGAGYYGSVGQGVALQEVVNRGVTELKMTQLTIERVTNDDEPDANQVEDNQTGATLFNPVLPEKIKSPFLERYEPAMKAAIGLDFLDVSTLGKIFRVLQILTQILLVIGCIYIFKNRKKYSAEYLAFVGASIIILAACILSPSFSPILNASRFYHIALLAIAPAIILGGKLIFRKSIILVCLILIPYFVFTTGIVFEATKRDDISTLEIPYSLSLSGPRVSVTGVYTDADNVCRYWIQENNTLPIYGDMGGASFLVEIFGTYNEDIKELRMGFYPVWPGAYEQLPAYKVAKAVPSNAYLFLTEWNEENQRIIRYTGIGLRESIAYEESAMDVLINGREVIFQCGNAKVYGQRH